MSAPNAPHHASRRELARPASSSRPTRVRGGRVAVVLLALNLVRAYPLAAQVASAPGTPIVPTVPAGVATTPYRAPSLVLAQPPGGTTIPTDRPSVVFRLVAGEEDDPVDPRSFSITVDGRDRTALFQLSSAEAWGPLVRPAENGGVLAAGAHQIAARLCSARGACTSVTAIVTAAPDPAHTAPAAALTQSRRARILDLLLSGARKLVDRS